MAVTQPPVPPRNRGAWPGAAAAVALPALCGWRPDDRHSAALPAFGMAR